MGLPSVSEASLQKRQQIFFTLSVYHIKKYEFKSVSKFTRCQILLLPFMVNVYDYSLIL